VSGASVSDLWNHPFTIPDDIWEILLHNEEKLMPRNIEELRQAIGRYESMPDYQRKHFFGW